MTGETKRLVDWTTVGMLVLFFLLGGSIAYGLASWLLPCWIQVPAAIISGIGCVVIYAIVRGGDDPMEDIRDRIHEQKTTPRKKS